MTEPQQAPKEEELPAWVPCPDCDDFWCMTHSKHVHDCDCPGIDNWIRCLGTSPYEEGRGIIFSPPEER